MRLKLITGLIVLFTLSSICFGQNAKYIYQYVDVFEGTDEPRPYNLLLSNNTDNALFNVTLQDGEFYYFSLTIFDNTRTFEITDELIVLIKGSDGKLDRIIGKPRAEGLRFDVFFTDIIHKSDRGKLYDADLIGVRLYAHNKFYTFKDNLSSEQRNYFKGIAKELEQVKTGTITLQVGSGNASNVIK